MMYKQSPFILDIHTEIFMNGMIQCLRFVSEVVNIQAELMGISFISFLLFCMIDISILGLAVFTPKILRMFQLKFYRILNAVIY